MPHRRIEERTDGEPHQSRPGLTEITSSLLGHGQSLVRNRPKVVGIERDGDLGFRQRVLEHARGAHVAHGYQWRVRTLRWKLTLNLIEQPFDPVRRLLVGIRLHQILRRGQFRLLHFEPAKVEAGHGLRNFALPHGIVLLVLVAFTHQRARRRHLHAFRDVKGHIVSRVLA